MKLNLKTSSNIQEAIYDEEVSRLLVEFTSGSMYLYFDVPKSICENWEKVTSTPAGSVGNYFHHFIRNSFDYLKIGE